MSEDRCVLHEQGSNRYENFEIGNNGPGRYDGH